MCNCLQNEGKSIDMDAHKRAKINILRREVLGLSLHEFDLGRKVAEPTNCTCSTMGPSEMSIHTARYRFDRFHNRKYEVEDRSRSKADFHI